MNRPGATKRNGSLNDEEHLRASSEREVLKVYFLVGIMLGALAMFILLALFGAIK